MSTSFLAANMGKKDGAQCVGKRSGADWGVIILLAFSQVA